MPQTGAVPGRINADALHVQPADPRDPALADLIRRHAAYGDAHYRAESNHHLSPEDLVSVDATLFAIWMDGCPIAMGALAPFGPGKAEIKSMHVREEFRGHGIGAVMLTALMDAARERGLTSLWLETGSRAASAAARAVYEKAGFTLCAPFGTYVEDPESVFMTCRL